MGFALSQRSVHEGQLEPGGRRLAWGTAGHCITFGAGYLELVGVLGDTDYAKNVASRAAKREGVHQLALSTNDLAALRRSLGTKIVGMEEPQYLLREWPYGESTRPATFQMAHLDGEIWPEADLALVEHRSRHLIWPDDLPRHPNGAEALAFVILAAREPARSRERFSSLLGPPHGSMFRLRDGRLTVTDLVGITRRYPDAQIAEPPFPAAVGVRVDDLDRVRHQLIRNHVAHQRTPNDSIWVGPAQAGGCVIEFVVERPADQRASAPTLSQRITGRAVDRDGVGSFYPPDA